MDGRTLAAAVLGVVAVVLVVAWCEAAVRRHGAGGGRRVRAVARRVGMALALLVVLLAGTLAQMGQAGIGLVSTAAAHARPNSTSQPRPYQPPQDHGGKPVVLPGQLRNGPKLPKATPFRPSAVTMKAGDLALDASADAHFVGSDKRLEVTVPTGAVTAGLVSAAGGSVSLHIEELEGPSGGTSSGRVSLGTYRFTLIGPHGQVAGTLAKPLLLTLHLNGWRGAGFDLSHVTLLINGGVPGSALAGANGTVAAHITPSHAPATFNVQAGTLSAQLPIAASSSGGGTTGTWNTDSPEAQWSKQTDTSADLSSGDLTYSYPLDVPAGPGGLTPKLQLSYDSAAVTNNHNPQATSGWLGEGWDLSAGSISWGEHNVTATCTILTCNCPNYDCATWENSWQFSDAGQARTPL